jgi:choline dehydrogenase-like flavoprotein
MMIGIVGSGPVGAALAYALAVRGHRVTVLERGPEHSFPQSDDFMESVRNNYMPQPIGAADLQVATQEGDYGHPVNGERAMRVGGTSTVWAAWTPRMVPEDFQTRSRFGFGEDWPITYDDLEPWYGAAEELLGVSGTDDDNPFAPRRSKPFPLPAFALGHYDRQLSDRLRAGGIHVHSTPQARTRRRYDGRPACMNFGTCFQCPIGARYAANHHIAKATATGRCTIIANASVRRVAVAADGRATALVYRTDGSATDQELGVDVVVVAGGAIESARLLLLSSRDHAGPGLGVESGHVGRHLVFNHTWRAELVLDKSLVNAMARSPLARGQSHQFVNPPNRGKHGGLKIELQGPPRVDPLGMRSFRAHGGQMRLDPQRFKRGVDVLAALEKFPHSWPIGICGETGSSGRKSMDLSTTAVDRFGDPAAHVRYRFDDFDHETHAFARTIFDRIVAATRPIETVPLGALESSDSGHHHHGTCRMSRKQADGVVDPFCRVHGSPNLFVVGGAAFPAAGVMNPTLTMVALALRTADHIATRSG